MTKLDTKLERALDSNVKWVLDVLTDYDKRGHPAMKEAIAALTDEEKDSVIRVLLMIQAGTIAEVREAIRDQLTREQFDGLGDSPTLN